MDDVTFEDNREDVPPLNCVGLGHVSNTEIEITHNVYLMDYYTFLIILSFVVIIVRFRENRM